jgi:hypothetical protein
MMHNLTRKLAEFSDRAAAYALHILLEPIFNRFKSVTLNSAGLVIKAGSSALAKTGSSVTHYIANGIKGRIAASTDMPALTGINVANGKFNVIIFSVDSTGTVRVRAGTEGSTEAAIKWPPLDQKRAIIGFLIINPTGSGTFTGGTTALDDATVIPNVAYISPVGAFDPTTSI